MNPKIALQIDWPVDALNYNSVYWDSSYVYICTATNSWKRIALSTWRAALSTW